MTEPTPEAVSTEMPETRQLLSDKPGPPATAGTELPQSFLSLTGRPESAVVTPAGRAREAGASFGKFCLRSLKHTRSFSHCGLAKSFS